MRSALLAAVVFAAGCAVPGKQPAKVEIELPAAYAGGANRGNEVDGRWWSLYGDEALSGLIREALDRNRDARIAAARVEEARALVGPADLSKLPRLSAGAGMSHQQLPQNAQFQMPAGTNRRIGLHGASVDAAYEIDLWGRIASLSEVARSTLLSTQYAEQTVRIGLIADVATAYFDVLTLRREVEVTADSIANRDKFVDLTRKRHAAGRASLAEVARAESSLAQAAARRPLLELGLAQSGNRLAVLIGRMSADTAKLVPAAAKLPSPPEIPAGLPAQLLQRRPDILAAEHELVGAGGRVRAQRAALLPGVTLTGSLGTQSRDLSQLFSGPGGSWSLGVALLAPIIDAERNRFRVQAQEAVEKQAALRYEKAVESALREVLDALAARSLQAEALSAAQAQASSLQQLAGFALRRYEAGAATYLEVVDAQGELLNAQIGLAEARRNLLAATVFLYKALGGGWDPEAVRAAATGDSARQ